MKCEIDYKELSILSETVRDQLCVTVEEQESGFILLVSRDGNMPSVLVSQRKQKRMFRRLDSAAGFIRELGIKSFTCVLSSGESSVSHA